MSAGTGCSGAKSDIETVKADRDVGGARSIAWRRPLSGEKANGLGPGTRRRQVPPVRTRSRPARMSVAGNLAAYRQAGPAPPTGQYSQPQGEGKAGYRQPRRNGPGTRAHRPGTTPFAHYLRNLGAQPLAGYSMDAGRPPKSRLPRSVRL